MPHLDAQERDVSHTCRQTQILVGANSFARFPYVDKIPYSPQKRKEKQKPWDHESHEFDKLHECNLLNVIPAKAGIHFGTTSVLSRQRLLVPALGSS
jgi:hypothetical protein